MAFKKRTPKPKVETIAFYGYKESDDPHPNERVLTKGTIITGRFVATFTDKEYGAQKHYFDTEEGRINIKGCTSLNNELEGAERGAVLQLTFLGKGAKNPGKKPPFLWEVADGDDSDTSVPAPTRKTSNEDSDEEAPASRRPKLKTKPAIEDDSEEEELDNEAQF